MLAQSVLDLVYRVRGDVVRAGSGYRLYAALLTVWPDLRADFDVRVGPLERLGKRLGQYQEIGSSARLRLRCAVSSVSGALRLDGARLAIGYSMIDLHSPEIQQIRPSSSLWCSSFFLSSSKTGECRRNPTRAQVEEVLCEFAPQAQEIMLGEETTISMRGLETQRGYAVGLVGLPEQASLEIQCYGLGTDRAALSQRGSQRGAKAHMGGQMWLPGILPRGLQWR